MLRGNLKTLSPADVASDPPRRTRSGFRRLADAVIGFGPRHGGWTTALRKARRVLVRKGLSGFLARAGRYVGTLSSATDAAPWSDTLSYRDSEKIHSRCRVRPKLSVLIAVRPESLAHLADCLGSLTSQHYDDWEVFLIASPGDVSAVREFQAASETVDVRISIEELDDGVSDAASLNIVAAETEGSWLIVLDPTDTLSSDAFTWLVASINERPDATAIYSDSITVDSSGRCIDTQFKPDFSPEYLLASHFTGHLTAVRVTAFLAVRGFREVASQSLEHDLMLRLSETGPPDRIVHIPRALSQQRHPGSSGARQPASPQVVSDALTRRGLTGSVATVATAPDVFSIRLTPRSSAKVSIFVATRNASELVRDCVQSIHAHTSWPDYEVVVINNQSDEPALLDYLAVEEAAGTLRVFDYDRPFNHSDMHNEAVASTDGDLIVLLNNDVRITSPDWIEQMVATIESEPSIAGVGSLLTYPDGTVQHAGVLLGANGGVAGHFFRDMVPDTGGYNNRLFALQEISACTAACVMVRRMAWNSVGGFDADQYPTSYNDVDLWIRLRRSGYRCIYNPLVTGIHDESRTRRIEDARETDYREQFQSQWANALDRDRFHNPNLSLESEQLSTFNRREVPGIVEPPVLVSPSSSAHREAA